MNTKGKGITINKEKGVTINNSEIIEIVVISLIVFGGIWGFICCFFESDPNNRIERNLNINSNEIENDFIVELEIRPPTKLLRVYYGEELRGYRRCKPSGDGTGPVRTIETFRKYFPDETFEIGCPSEYRMFG